MVRPVEDGAVLAGVGRWPDSSPVSARERQRELSGNGSRRGARRSRTEAVFGQESGDGGWAKRSLDPSRDDAQSVLFKALNDGRLKITGRGPL